jgi:hypothetical protein
VRFIETPVFTRAVQRHLDDDAYRALQLALVLRPEQGAVIPGGAGVRKMRWALKGKGRRGGLRVIYYWAPADETFHMLYAYSKSQQGDLSAAQTRTLARIIREELK